MHRSLARCTACRISVLDAFTGLAGLSISASSARQSLRQSQIKPSRHFSQFSRARQSVNQTSESIAASETPLESQTQPQSFIPWYLQVDEPTPPSTPFSPLLSLQEIPPLPPNPPSILSPVLEHLSTQIGLDNLVLLDLRHLDPPPALGSNLLMIIGTARSVKHLNVSADRFCRWARKEYKLRPYADGLLGRNELKLKLRRKARRLRLAQSVGNTTMEQENTDDGITTGWICVNMGSVDVDVTAEQQVAALDGGVVDERVGVDGMEVEEEEYSNPPEEETYAGFGSRSTAPRIVVQMFTEDKRVEMDLEGLWDIRNTRRARRDQRADAAFESTNAESEGQVEKDEIAKSWDQSATPLADEVDNAKKREDSDETKPLGRIEAS